MCIFLDTDLAVSSRLSVRSDNRLVQNSRPEPRTEIHVVFPGPRRGKSDGRDDIWPLTVDSLTSECLHLHSLCLTEMNKRSPIFWAGKVRLTG